MGRQSRCSKGGGLAKVFELERRVYLHYATALQLVQGHARQLCAKVPVGDRSGSMGIGHNNVCHQDKMRTIGTMQNEVGQDMTSTATTTSLESSERV